MEAAELRSLLNEGIQAVKTNDRPLARERLLRVLAADDKNAAAWLWLSAALDEPADQLLALERVLAINPRHPQALAGAQALRQRLHPSGPPVPAATPATSDPASEPEPVSPAALVSAGNRPILDLPTTVPPSSEVILPAEQTWTPSDTFFSEDDPFQCAYCGRPTHPNDERCPHCGRNLLAPGLWRGGGYLYFALLIAGIQLQLALVQALATYAVSVYPQFMTTLPLASAWVGHLALPAIIRVLAWAIVVLLMLGDYSGGFGVAALVAALDLAWAAIGYQLGLLPAAPAELNAALGIVIFFIGLLAVISQAQSRVRLRVVLDRNLEAAVLLHRRALTYANQGKWALAALHWRRAITRAPSEPVYYKSLGRANVALGRYAEAVRAYKSGAAVAPNDRDFGRLIETVRAHTRSS